MHIAIHQIFYDDSQRRRLDPLGMGRGVKPVRKLDGLARQIIEGIDTIPVLAQFRLQADQIKEFPEFHPVR